LHLLHQFHFPVFEAWTLARLSEVELASGKASQARERAHQALAVSATGHFPYPQALAQRMLGRVSRSEGSLTEAADWLSRAVDALDRIEARHDAALTRVDLAAVRHALGASAEAAALLEHARSEFEAMGVPHLAQLAFERVAKADGPPRTT
jgi:ATP/maltotriose-dependent transcriptional regulator MalT